MKRCVVLVALVACGGSEPAPERPLIYGGDRPVELQVPTAFEEGEQYPLVLLLHGYGVTGILQSAYLGLADLPTDPGVFYLTPDGTIDSLGKTFWTARAACCAHAADNPPDDVAYLGGILDEVMADWPVDPTRVLVMGHSNGGFMTYRMACDRADIVTAIAPIAGAAPQIDGSDCELSRPVSVLHIHGDIDDTIPYDGVPDGDFAFPGAVASVQQLAGKDDCDPTLTDGPRIDIVRTSDGDETRTARAGCSGGVGIELWTMEGVGHVPNVTDDFATIVAGWLIDHPRE